MGFLFWKKKLEDVVLREEAFTDALKKENISKRNFTLVFPNIHAIGDSLENAKENLKAKAREEGATHVYSVSYIERNFPKARVITVYGDAYKKN